VLNVKEKNQRSSKEIATKKTRSENGKTVESRSLASVRKRDERLRGTQDTVRIREAPADWAVLGRGDKETTHSVRSRHSNVRSGKAAMKKRNDQENGRSKKTCKGGRSIRPRRSIEISREYRLSLEERKTVPSGGKGKQRILEGKGVQL